MFVTLVSLFSILVLFIYLWFKRNSEYWKNINVPHPKPHLFFGNLKDSLVLKKNLIQLYAEIYNDFQEFPYVGFFKIRTPALLIRDPELIYGVLTKDFLSFEINDAQIDEKLDPLIASNPFFLRGEKWRKSRSQLAMCFTPGKIKQMLPLLIKVSEDMMKYIDHQMKSGFATLEAKELSAKFTTDNVASCGFGLEAKSFSETEAEFRKVGSMIFSPGPIKMLQVILVTLFPSLVKVLKIKSMSDEVEGYFREIVKSALLYREEKKIVRNDFLDNMNLIREKDPSYSIDHVTSQAFSFFLDGFETSSIGLSYAIYELASNRSVQEKVRKEVDDTLVKHNNVWTYECLQEITYLDCVISESLRLHPPGAALLKLCTGDYFFPAINGNKRDLLVKSGTPIVIPVYGIHRDSKYFRDPEVFNPDRFSDENKMDIKKGTYLPFGDGPRICLGQRFGLIQMKVGLAVLLKNFEISVNEKTKEPLEIDEKYMMLSAKGGLWVDYIRRG